MLSKDNGGTRERSIQAALEVVREQGLQELTTRAIAKRSGLTQPAIYRHFSGVDELTRETLGAIRSLAYRQVQELGDGTDPEERLRGTLGAFRELAIDEPRLYDALFLQAGDGALTPPPLEAGRGENIFGYVAERVTECARSGVIRQAGPVASALSLVAHAQGLILMYRQGRFGSKERFREAYDRSISDLLRGLREV